MNVIFRHKNKDNVIMAFNVEENKVYDDTINDSNAVYLDMDDYEVGNVILALCELRGPKTFNIEKYIEALNDLLGVDHAYFCGDENVEAIVELIVMAKELAEENNKLMAFKEYFDKLYGTCLEVANWHLNGELEPFDNFYESAKEVLEEKK